MTAAIGHLLRTTGAFLAIVVAIVGLAALVGGGLVSVILVGSLPLLLLLAVPSGLAAGAISLLPRRGVARRIVAGVMAGTVAAACGYVVTYLYVSGLDYGPYADELPEQRATMAATVAIVLAIAGAVTGLAIRPADHHTPT